MVTGVKEHSGMNKGHGELNAPRVALCDLSCPIVLPFVKPLLLKFGNFLFCSLTLTESEPRNKQLHRQKYSICPLFLAWGNAEEEGL